MNPTSAPPRTSLDRPWLAHYPAGINWEAATDAYPNVVALIEEAFVKHASRPAQENLGHTMTYAEVDRLSLQFASFLQARGLKPGDTLAIQMPNILQYVVALFGGIRAGLRIVNLNPLYTADEMRGPLQNSNAKAIVVLANFAHKLEAIRGTTALDLVVVTELADSLPGLKRPIVNALVKYVKKMVPAFSLPGAVPFRNALSEGRRSGYQRPQVNADQTLFFQFTGGTTGIPKAADLTHRNIVANVLQCREAFKLLKVGEESLVAALPFYHIFGLTVNCLFLMHMGARLILVTNPKDIPAFLKQIKDSHFTVFTGLNTLFNAMMNHPSFTEIDFSQSKLFVAGGMALQSAVGDRWLKLTGKPILEGYGLSETSPVLACNNVDQNTPGTIGQPFPMTEIAILDENGDPVPLGERGEICAKGPQVMRGYFNHPEETARAFFEGGWFRTGDIGAMDEKGYVRIVDRKKDMILVSGFNVYPNEVEEVVVNHPGVLECAVIGIPDPDSTERVKAFVVRREATLSEAEVIAHCKQSLTGYKVPKVVEFCSELPKNNVGKVLRRELR